MPFAQKQIGFEMPPRLFLKHDEKNGADPLGKTAFYEPAEKSITLYTTGRHPKDILRSLGHELVHHKQNCEGKFDDVGEMGEGYAQTNPHLRQMEEDANRDGSMCVRDFEDTLKRENTIYFEHLQKGDINMSTKDWKNGELKVLLSEAWGFKMDLNKLNEGEMPMATDTKDADDDGDTEDKVPAFLKEKAAADDADAEVVEEEVDEGWEPESYNKGTRDKEDVYINRGSHGAEPETDTDRKYRRAKEAREDARRIEDGLPPIKGKYFEEKEDSKSDLSESRLREIIAYALKTKV